MLKQLQGDTVKVLVDLNVEKGKPSSNRQANQFEVNLRFSRILKFDLLRTWLQGKCNFDVQCLEMLSLMDHLIRETPSQAFTVVRKSYFPRGPGTTLEIGTQQGSRDPPSGIEMAKGVFASIRAAYGAALNKEPRLTLNVDVANVCFYKPDSLLTTLLKFGRFRDVNAFANECRKVRQQIANIRGAKDKKEFFRRSNLYDDCLKKFNKVRIEYKHQQARPGQPKERYNVEKIAFDSFPKTHTFTQDTKDANGNVINSKVVSVWQYFKDKYNFTCNENLPLVKTTKGDMVPIELCDIPAGIRYPFKLSGSETDAMLGFAVTLPQQRWQSVETSLRTLNWQQDPVLKNYGLEISTAPAKVTARYLDRPTIEFKPVNAWNPAIRAQVTKTGGQRGAPKSSIQGKPCDDGRWDLMGVQFLNPNRQPLVSWGFAIVDQGRGPCTSPPQASNFAKTFTQTYMAHGGLISTIDPICFSVSAREEGEMITAAWNTIGKKYNRRPQLIFFVVNGKIGELYRRIKKSCDCRYGVPSQVLQSRHVEKAQAQYCSNVALKVNAKLGGSTSRTSSKILPKLTAPNTQHKITAIMGADVSHAAPGLDQASLAAMTLNMDQQFSRYLARCQTNGNRVEMIQTKNIDTCLKELFKLFMAAHQGRLPDRLLYMRDGVSEGQYPQVLDYEVKDIKRLLQVLNPNIKCDVTVVIAAKRHHIRFFPGAAGDRNQNPKPGTLVETGCTHPFEFDWYMCSHAAIKGTARPIHYHVLLNENEAFQPHELQQMIFEHSYQYVRATTPISQHPAVAYAHLASKRAECQLQGPPKSDGKKDDKKKDDDTTTSDPKKKPEPLPLLVMPEENAAIGETMWFI